MRCRQHPAKMRGEHMRTCILAHTETLPANKITKKSGKNRDGHLKQKKERTYALFQCVHAYMCTRSKKSQPKVRKLVANRKYICDSNT